VPAIAWLGLQRFCEAGDLVGIGGLEEHLRLDGLALAEDLA
jgi:hypothetical protein